MKPRWLAAATLLALSGFACGGARPTAPSAASRPDPGIGSGTVLSLVTADTGQPAAEATVMVAGHSYASDTTGHVVLAQGVTSGSPLDILAAGMLDRQTLLRSPSDTAFSLWPRSSPTGLDESYTRQIVYSWASDDNPGNSPLYRLAGTEAVLVPSAGLQADSSAMAAHRRAAEEVNAAVGGAVHYSLAAEAPAGAVAFSTVLDPEDAGCEDPRLHEHPAEERRDLLRKDRVLYDGCVARWHRRARGGTHVRAGTLGGSRRGDARLQDGRPARRLRRPRVAGDAADAAAPGRQPIPRQRP